MRNNRVLGLLFPNNHDEALREFTAERALGSVPFGGRYRLVDFALSGMAHAGIGKVGLITKRNAQSLMEHLGSGKAWGLSRKTEGLYYLAPHDVPDNLYEGRVAALHSLDDFLESSLEDVVVLSDCHVVSPLSYKALIESHIDSGADVTIVCRRGACPSLSDNLLLELNDDGDVTSMRLGVNPDGDHICGLGIYVIQKDLLRRLVAKAAAENFMHFDRDVLLPGLQTLRIRGYEAPAETHVISSPETYFEASTALLDDKKRAALLPLQNPVYTINRDVCPAVYGLNSSVSDSLVADGSFVDGTVKHSILFRDVRVEKGAVVENAILMQGTVVKAGARVSHAILDKNVVLSEGKSLTGLAEFPLCVKKGKHI